MKHQSILKPLLLGVALGESAMAYQNSLDSDEIAEKLDGAQGIIVSMPTDSTLGKVYQQMDVKIYSHGPDIILPEDLGEAWDRSEPWAHRTFQFEEIAKGPSQNETQSKVTPLLCRTHPSHYYHMHRKRHADDDYIDTKRSRYQQEKRKSETSQFPNKSEPRQKVSRAQSSKIDRPLPPISKVGDRVGQWEQRGKYQQRNYDEYRRNHVDYIPGQRIEKDRPFRASHGTDIEKWRPCFPRFVPPIIDWTPAKGKSYEQVKPIYRHKDQDYKYQKPLCNSYQNGTTKCYYQRAN